MSVKSGFLMPVSPSDDAVNKDAAESEEEDEAKDRGQSRGRGREETDEEAVKRRRFMERLESKGDEDDMRCEEGRESSHFGQVVMSGTFSEEGTSPTSLFLPRTSINFLLFAASPSVSS